MHQSTAPASAAVLPSLAAQVRDTLVLNESVIVECVNEVLGDLPAYKAEVFRQLLKADPAFAAAIKRLTVDVGVILSLAKSFESDETFAESAGLMHDIDFAGFGGKLGHFAKAMVELDLKGIERAVAGDGGDDAVLYDMMPTDVLERRLRMLLGFIGHAIKRPH